MSDAEVEGLKLFVLAMPVIIVAVALLTVWLTAWQDAREDRRRAQRAVAGE